MYDKNDVNNGLVSPTNYEKKSCKICYICDIVESLISPKCKIQKILTSKSLTKPK